MSTATLPHLARWTEAELAAAYGGSLDSEFHRAVEAELERRDRAEAARRQRRAARRMVRADAIELAVGQAEAATNGVMLNAAGLAMMRAGKLTERTLFTGRADWARRYASDELLAHWETNPRPTEAMFAGANTRLGHEGDYRPHQRSERERWLDAQEAAREAVESDERDRIRPVPAGGADGAAAVNRVRVSGQQEGGPHGDAGHAGAAGGGDGIDRAALGRLEAAYGTAGGTVKRACEHRDRIGTPKQCSDCPLPGPGRAAAPARAYGTDPAAALKRLQARQAEKADSVLRGVLAVPEGAQATPVARRDRDDIDGAQALAYARMFLARFAVWPSEAALTAVTLWVAHSHARDAAGTLVWQATPRLLFSSAEPGSGKSWAMRLAARLCPAPSVFTEPSEPAVAHAIGRERATLALDEIDVLFGRGTRKAAIRAVINDGYSPDGVWARVRSGQVDKISTFGALMLAGLDAVETSTDGHLAALLTRCIRIRMRRAPADYRPPRFDQQARFVATAVSDRLGAWCQQELGEMAALVPEVPEGIGNRPAELWEPLLAVADIAGGDWPVAARDACEELVATGGMPPEDDDKISRLDDIMAGWGEEL